MEIHKYYAPLLAMHTHPKLLWTITDNCTGTLQKKKQTISSIVKDQLCKSLPGLVWQGTSESTWRKCPELEHDSGDVSTNEWGDWPMHSLLHQTEWSPHYLPPVDWTGHFTWIRRCLHAPSIFNTSHSISCESAVGCCRAGIT